MNNAEKILLLVGVGVVAAFVAYEVYQDVTAVEASVIGTMAAGAVFLICPPCFLASAAVAAVS